MEHDMMTNVWKQKEQVFRKKAKYTYLPSKEDMKSKIDNFQQFNDSSI